MTDNQQLERMLCPVHADTLLRPKEVERLLPITANHLAQLRHDGMGPRYAKHGRLIIYRAGDVSEWLMRSVIDPTPSRVPEPRRRSAPKRTTAAAAEAAAGRRGRKPAARKTAGKKSA
jgi:hypothetical protein